MGFFEDAARAVGFSPESFKAPGYDAVWSQLKPWLGNLTTTGVLKWIPRAASQLPCQVPEYQNGYPVGPCAHHALDTCLICGRPVCLTHAFVEGQRGDAVCYLCVVQVKAKASGGASPPDPEPRHEQQAPPPPDPRADAKQKAWWARGVLGVQEGVKWQDIKLQYKKLSAQFHPDRPGGDEARFKNVQTAYDVLKKVYGEN